MAHRRSGPTFPISESINSLKVSHVISEDRMTKTANTPRGQSSPSIDLRGNKAYILASTITCIDARYFLPSGP